MQNSEHIPTAAVAETRYPLSQEEASRPLFPVCVLLQWQEKRIQELSNLRKKTH